MDNILEEPLEFAEVWLGDEYPTKEEAHENVNKRFLYILQTFFRAASMKSKHNDAMLRIYFHSLLGAYLKEYTMIKPGGVTDLRIPVIWVQNSGSGKSQLNKATMDFARRLGVSCTDSTKFTEAGLIGTFDKSKHDYNIKNNLHPGEESMKMDKLGNQKRVAYQKPIIYGDLHNYDMLFIDEAKILFEKSKHTEDILSVLQPALDFPGRVRKKLAAEEPIEYDCQGTILASTVEWSDVGKDIMSQGYFPRCAFYARNLAIQEQMEHQADLLRSGNYDENKYNEHLNNFADMFEKHKIPIIREKRRIMLDDNCLDLVAIKVEKWFKEIQDNLYGQDAKVVQSLVARMHLFIFKLAGQMAVVNNKINIKIKNEIVFLAGQEEVEYAFDILDHLFAQLMNNISINDTNEDRHLYTTMIAILKVMNDGKITEMSRRDFINKIITLRAVGRHKAQKMYSNLFTSNYFSEKNVSKEGVVVCPNWSIWHEKDKKIKGVKDAKIDI